MFSTESISDTTFRLLPSSQDTTEFRILQVTDLHLGHISPSKPRIYREVREMCDRFKVDLVINTGDFFCDSPEFWIHKIIRDFDRTIGYPWAFAWGNHDADHFNVDHWFDMFDRVEKQLARMPHCLYKITRKIIEDYGSDKIKEDPREKEAYFSAMDAAHSVQDKKERQKLIHTFDGFYGGNYQLQICHPQTQQPIWDLYVMNSRRGYHIPPKALHWMKDQMEKQESRLPAMLFYHIPNYEFETYWDADHAHGIKGEKVCFEKDRGEIHGFFKTLGTIKACFVGHDHVNDYYFDLDGIRYVYGRKTGIFAYGGRWNVKGQFEYGRKAIKPGAKLITLKFGDGSENPMDLEWNQVSVFPDGSAWEAHELENMGTIK